MSPPASSCSNRTAPKRHLRPPTIFTTSAFSPHNATVIRIFTFDRSNIAFLCSSGRVIGCSLYSDLRHLSRSPFINSNQRLNAAVLSKNQIHQSLKRLRQKVKMRRSNIFCKTLSATSPLQPTLVAHRLKNYCFKHRLFQP